MVNDVMPCRTAGRTDAVSARGHTAELTMLQDAVKTL